jgi:antitoxin (DNA-binding transcriptional repressor) of toxin-antitoxin stability system
MRKVSITEAKNRLSALLDSLRSGSPVMIVDRGRPVARLEAPTSAGELADGALLRLVRDGIVRPARAPFPPAILSSPPPSANDGVSILQALLADRLEGR